MHFSTVASGLVLMSGTSLAQFVLEQDFFSNNFFDNFDFFTGSDPTHGFVQYVDAGTASSAGYTSTNGQNAYIGVDHTTNGTPNGRASVRISSSSTYSNGLVIVDIGHMPGGVCGTWPAFWMLAPDWPNNGEIDIIEGVNSQTTNQMTLHTSDNCTITNNGAFSGNLDTTNCYINAPDQASNAGCGISSTDTTSYGSGFNSANGGVYATQIDDNGNAITIWFFSRNNIPDDITNGSPDPSGWGTPAAQFQGGCDIPSHFNGLSIVFDNTFCGDWAGAVWGSDATCGPLADSCNDYVSGNPDAFGDAYWIVNSLKVYSSGAGDAGFTKGKSSLSNTTSPVRRALRQPVNLRA